MMVGCPWVLLYHLGAFVRNDMLRKSFLYCSQFALCSETVCVLYYGETSWGEVILAGLSSNDKQRTRHEHEEKEQDVAVRG